MWNCFHGFSLTPFGIIIYTLLLKVPTNAPQPPHLVCLRGYHNVIPGNTENSLNMKAFSIMRTLCHKNFIGTLGVFKNRLFALYCNPNCLLYRCKVFPRCACIVRQSIPRPRHKVLFSPLYPLPVVVVDSKKYRQSHRTKLTLYP